jgi:hypothetical protein
MCGPWVGRLTGPWRAWGDGRVHDDEGIVDIERGP